MAKINKFELLKFISQTHRELHAKRQQYEWRILFTVLTFYILSVAATFSRNSTTPNFHWFHSAVWCAFLLLAVVSSGFLLYIHRANSKNKSYAEEAEQKLVECLDPDKEVKLSFSETSVRFTWWAFSWQATTLFIVAIASATFITANW
jgi:uncharacterized membrane protein (DUF485 family)